MSANAWVSGIDISKWQGIVNWDTVRDSGIQYVYMRAFNGNRQDSTLQRNAEGARWINMPFGLYTYWRPRDSAEEQARRLIDAHRTHGATLIPMIDVEHQDNKTPEQIATSVTDGVRIIEQELGVSPVIYTAAWFWNPAVGRNHGVGHCPLWLARYSVPNPIPTNPQDWPSAAIGRREPVIPHGWDRWDAWQFSADGNHMGPTYGMTSSHLDLNILRGDVWPRFDANQPPQPATPEGNMLFDKPKNAWEQAGYEIGLHTTSKPLRWDRVDSIVVHYTADKHANRDTANYLRAMQRSYVNGRGYSLGYSCAIDQDGVCWEIRGTDYMPAATKGENSHTFAVLMLVDWQDKANHRMVERMRQLVAAIRQHTQANITGHRDWAATRCPGDGISNQIDAADFEPRKPQPEPPTPNLGRNLDVRMVNPPIRLYDSRHAGAHSPSSTTRIRITDAEAAFVNITVVNPSRDGYITAWGTGPMPNVSNVNYERTNICCTAWVPLDNGFLNLFTSQECHILVDLQAVA